MDGSNLRLTQPLAIIDLESTGVDPANDRIVEIAVVKLHPDGSPQLFHERVKPPGPIPVSAIAIHGITKLIMSEARNFPDIAAFYQQEVIRPGTELVRRILQRGVARGEFRALDVEYAVFSIIAPMVFLVMMKHSLGACTPQDYPLDPERYLRSQMDIILNGFCAKPDDKIVRSKK